jgi:hypothetical protein
MSIGVILAILIPVSLFTGIIIYAWKQGRKMRFEE